MARAAATGWVVLLVVMLLVGPDESGRGIGTGWVLAAGAGLAAMALMGPWARLPARALVALPIAAIATLMPIQSGAFATWDPDHALVVLLPVLWLALGNSRRALTAGLAIATSDFWTPVPMASPDRRPVLIAVGILFTALTTIVGFTVFELLRRMQAEERSAILARTDPLTGIGNRRRLEDELPARIARAEHERRPVTLALIDLDGFKTYNDDWGHLAGDRMLAHITRAWREGTRADDLLVRFGGDEFAVLFEDCTAEQAQAVLRRWADRMPAGQTFSAGSATAAPGESGLDLLRRADDALYAAKRRPGTAIRSDTARRAGAGMRHWDDRVDEMIADARIGAVLQPVVDMRTGTTMGFEAFARPLGEDPCLDVRGMFAAALRLGVSRAFDAICTAAAVRASVHVPDDELLFINVGVAALANPDHDVEQLLALLGSAGRDPGTVVLELNEAANDLGRFSEAIARHRAHGIRFALDDVGDGHSTFHALAAVHPEFLKISARLTGSVETATSRATLRAIATFADLTGATVIAEGLEEVSHIRDLIDVGVGWGQGHAFGRPTWPAAVERRLSA